MQSLQRIRRVYIPLTLEKMLLKMPREAPEVEMRTLAAARKHFRLTKSERDQITAFKALPGLYAMHKFVYQYRRITILSVHQVLAILACRQQPHTLAQAQLTSSERNHRVEQFTFMGSCALPYYNKQTGQIEHGISCAGCQIDTEDSYDAELVQAQDKVYARDDFLEHFRWCELAQRLWESDHLREMKQIELAAGCSEMGYRSRIPLSSI